MAFTRELLLSTERSILRSLFADAEVEIFSSRAFAWVRLETVAAVSATRQMPMAANARAHATNSLKRVQNWAVTPLLTRASRPPPRTTSNGAWRSTSRGRSYAFP